MKISPIFLSAFMAISFCEFSHSSQAQPDKNYDKMSLEILIQKADAGDAKACHELSLRYAVGTNGWDQDCKKYLII